MKQSEKSMLMALVLNTVFTVFECVGGLLTGSVAIFSDALHDAGDALSIAVAYVLERKSRHAADDTYTYGYNRFSVLGGGITTAVLLVGSVVVIVNAVYRLLYPTAIHYEGMIVFALIGAGVNALAAFVTHGGEQVNRKAVHLHMLEDVLGWIVVLIGAVVIRLTGWTVLDPLLSIGVAVFIAVHAVVNAKAVAELLLEKAPRGLTTAELREQVSRIDGVQDVRHIHVWQLDEHTVCATMHVVTNEDPMPLKPVIREQLAEKGLSHVTLEMETSFEATNSHICPIAHVLRHGCSHTH